MPTNTFRWARRLFQVAFAIAAIVGTILAWNREPHVRLIYQIQSPGGTPVLVDRCGKDDVSEYLYRVGPEGKQFNIDLCFQTMQRDRLNFIPYAADEEGVSWIELKNSPQVAAYTRAVARSFTLPQHDSEAALERWRKAKRQERFENLVELAVQLAVFWLCAYLTGRGIRRFYGGVSGQTGRTLATKKPATDEGGGRV